MKVAIFIAIIMVMRVVQSVFGKRTANLIPRNADGYLKYTAYYQGLAGVIAGVVLIVDVARGSGVNSLGMTVLYASISGIALGLTCVLGKYLLCVSTMALSSIFGTAGLLIPAVASIFLFGESMAWYQWIAMLVFMVGAYLIIGNSKKVYKKFTLKTLLLLIIYFVLNGLTMLMQKIFGMSIEGGNASMFSFVTFASGVIVAAVVLFVLSVVSARAAKKTATVPVSRENIPTDGAEIAATESVASEEPFRFIVTDKREKKLPPLIYLYGAFLAVAVFLINQLATLSTPLISSVILFTLINGGATVISALVGALMFREKLSVKGIIGLVLSIGALVLVQV